MPDSRFHKLISDLHVGVILHGKNAEILVSNPAARELLGMTEDEITGVPSYDPRFRIVRENGEAFHAERRPVATVLATKRAARNVVMGVVRPEGEVRWLLVNAEPELDPDGEVKQIVATLADITDRKHLEASLREAQKLESIGRLAGGVAHDFNNLLTVIRGCVELALASVGNVPARRDLEDALLAASRASALTRQLLTFARRQPSTPRVIDLGETLTKLSPLLERLVGDSVRVVTNIAADAWRARIDPSQLEQAVVNLFVNARDAMPSGGEVTLTVSNETATHPSKLESGEYVRIAVADTGVGMNAETRDRIFEPFFTTKGPGHGTGLGLATTHGIVDKHGGFLRVASEVGKGTTFHIYLPRTTEALLVEQAEPPADPARGKESLLVIEDHTLVRRSTVRTLERAGYRVLEAADGVEGLEVLRAHPETSLVVTDAIMPRLDGVGFARALRVERPTLPVIFVSGYQEAPAPPELGRSLTKPFGAAELLDLVRAMLDARR